MRWLIIAAAGVAAIFAVAATLGERTHTVHSSTADTPIANPGAAEPNLAAQPFPVWKAAGVAYMPKVYYQGVTSDPEGNLYFDGIFSGLYRTTADLHETARNNDVIAPDVRAQEGYNHIGDISWDPNGGGRLLLPLDCFHPKEQKANTCGTGAIGVADPKTLSWRYYVQLDPRDIKKATWNEVSPDGKLVWTSSGRALLAYRTADINPANAGPNGREIRPVRRMAHAVPPSGITGATFYDGRLLVAGSNRSHGGPFQVWSISTIDGSRVLEIAKPIVGESEGLDTSSALDGALHWQIMPFNPQHRRPTYGYDHATLLQFRLIGQCANVERTEGSRHRLTGTSGGDKLVGGIGRDSLAGGRGRDCLFGGSRPDTLSGGSGDDRVVGGPGNDLLIGGPGADTIRGGSGDDVILAADGTRDRVLCGSGIDTVTADRVDTLVGCEKKQIR